MAEQECAGNVGKVVEDEPGRLEEIKVRCELAKKVMTVLRDLDDIRGKRTIRSDAADIIEGCNRDLFYLLGEIDRMIAERDAAVKANYEMAEYIVTFGRVDYILCDKIPEELHLKYQPANDGNYANEPCIKCVSEYFSNSKERCEKPQEVRNED